MNPAIYTVLTYIPYPGSSDFYEMIVHHVAATNGSEAEDRFLRSGAEAYEGLTFITTDEFIRSKDDPACHLDVYEPTPARLIGWADLETWAGMATRAGGDGKPASYREIEQ